MLIKRLMSGTCFPLGTAVFKISCWRTKEGSISMLGFEAILILAPFVKAKSTMTLKMVMLSNCIVTVLYVYIIIACYLFFSPDEILMVTRTGFVHFKGDAKLSYRTNRLGFYYLLDYLCYYVPYYVRVYFKCRHAGNIRKRKLTVRLFQLY